MVADEHQPQALRLDLLAEPRAAGAARRAVTEFAIGAGAIDGLAGDVALAVSEAVTNVVMHAYRDRATAGRVRIVAERVRQELVVTIADDGDGVRPRRDSPGLGLGLAIIARVTHTVEVEPRPTGGAELRMRFLLVADPAFRRPPPGPRPAGAAQGASGP